MLYVCMHVFAVGYLMCVVRPTRLFSSEIICREIFGGKEVCRFYLDLGRSRETGRRCLFLKATCVLNAHWLFWLELLNGNHSRLMKAKPEDLSTLKS